MTLRSVGSRYSSISRGASIGQKILVKKRVTFVVNAAIMANSWGGPKRFNKPIVVDIELPVWDDDDIDYERMRG